MLFLNLNSSFAGQIAQALGIVAPYAMLRNFGEVSIPYLPDDETTDPGHRIVRRAVDASAHIYLDAQIPSFVLPNGKREPIPPMARLSPAL